MLRRLMKLYSQREMKLYLKEKIKIKKIYGKKII